MVDLNGGRRIVGVVCPSESWLNRRWESDFNERRDSRWDFYNDIKDINDSLFI